MSQYFGDTEIKADKISSPTGSSSLDVNSRKLINVSNPTNAQDVATKSYVDSSGGGGGSGVSSFNTRTGAVTSTSGDYTATQVTNTPAGNISSTTVQAAINELDTEKQTALGYTAEDSANKSTTTTLGTSNTLYPTQNAVKAYVDSNKFGYTLYAYGGTFSPADLSLYYVGSLFNVAPMTSANASRVYVPKAGTIKSVYIFSNQVAGTSEACTLTFRLNNTTDTDLTTTFTQATTMTAIPLTGLSLAVSAGDYFEVKYLTPNWSTNPTNVRISLTFYIE